MTIDKININEHFVIPEGYFDNFTETMMSKLPEQDFQPMNISRRRRFLPQLGAAAAVTMLIISTAVYFSNQPSDDTQISQQSKSEILDIQRVNGAYTVEDAADCAMIDRVTMYEMITE